MFLSLKGLNINSFLSLYTLGGSGYKINMGANCCVAIKDKPLPSPLRFEVSTYRSSRHSPTWSFRWDNRTHIEDAMENATQFAQQDIENAVLEIKSESPNETEIFSDSGSPSDAFQLQKRLKSPVRIGTAGESRDVTQGRMSQISFLESVTCFHGTKEQ